MPDSDKFLGIKSGKASVVTDEIECFAKQGILLKSGRMLEADVIVTATVTLEHLAAGWTIMNIHLNVIARLPKVTQSRFIDATVRAKTSCLVSRLLRANISMNAKLEP